LPEVVESLSAMGIENIGYSHSCLSTQ